MSRTTTAVEGSRRGIRNQFTLKGTGSAVEPTIVTAWAHEHDSGDSIELDVVHEGDGQYVAYHHLPVGKTTLFMKGEGTDDDPDDVEIVKLNFFGEENFEPVGS